MSDYLVGASASLADLHLRRGEAEAADPLLNEAAQQALAFGSRWQLPEIYYLRGKWHVQRREPQQALTCASQALALAEELDLPMEAGIALRVMGHTAAAASDLEGATSSYERSLTPLADRDPYETARHRSSGVFTWSPAQTWPTARPCYKRPVPPLNAWGPGAICFNWML